MAKTELSDQELRKRLRENTPGNMRNFIVYEDIVGFIVDTRLRPEGHTSKINFKDERHGSIKDAADAERRVESLRSAWEDRVKISLGTPGPDGVTLTFKLRPPQM